MAHKKTREIYNETELVFAKSICLAAFEKYISGPNHAQLLQVCIKLIMV